MIVRVSLLFVSLFFISAAALADSAALAHVEKYIGAKCGKALDQLLSITKSVEKKADSAEEMEKLFSHKPVEQSAMTKILERSKSTTDPYESLAIKTYLRFSALGVDLMPSAFLADLEHGDAKRLAGLHTLVLEEMPEIQKENPKATERQAAIVAFALAFGEMGVGGGTVNVGPGVGPVNPADMLTSSRDVVVAEPPQIDKSIYLDPTQRSVESRDFEAGLRGKIVGQDEAVQAVVDLYQVFRAGLNSPGRPVGNLLFLGPTGAGKTRVVEAAAEVLFGDPRAVLKVDCAEFQHSHEIAKLIGSPPGYLGHRETHPLITQEALAQYHTEKLKISFLLFDEIEKASDSLWQLLLGVLDKATLTLGDNRRVDLSQTMIFMTSNLGGADITDIVNGHRGMGFAPPPKTETTESKAKQNNEIKATAVEAAKRKFAPEFMNRVDNTVVFHPLRSAQLEQVLDIELGMVQQRVLETAKGRFLFRVDQPAKDFLIKEGTDLKYGARHLKRAIERHLVFPLANLLSTDQVKLGDVITVTYNGGDKLTFEREAEGAIIPMGRTSSEKLAEAVASSSDGKLATLPMTAPLATVNQMSIGLQIPPEKK